MIINPHAMKNARQFGHAWLALTLVVAAHVADETLTHFLSFYNPLVLSLRARYAWFPMPTWEFWDWLTGLCIGVTVLLVLTRWAYKGSRALRILAYPYAVLMFLNGAGHLAGAAYFGSWITGATTAPLLIVASVWLFIAAAA